MATFRTHGEPNLQRFAETWAALIAAREGLEVVPGSVRVELKGGTDDLPVLQHTDEVHELIPVPGRTVAAV